METRAKQNERINAERIAAKEGTSVVDEADESESTYNDNHLASDGDDAFCIKCGENPCATVRVATFLKEEAAQLQKHEDCMAPNLLRKNMYRLYTYKIYGTLGAGNRVEIAICVIDRIRELFPNKEGDPNYMGYKSS